MYFPFSAKTGSSAGTVKASAQRRILYDASADGTSYYGRLSISNIRYENGDLVSVKKFLGVTFRSPTSIPLGQYDDVQLDPWAEASFEVQAADTVSASEFRITGELDFSGAHKFNKDTIQIGITGDLVSDPDLWTGSVVLAADAEPDISGTVNIEVDDAPDPALKDVKQTLYFSESQQGPPVAVPVGTTTAQRVTEGTYKVSVDSLSTENETYVAAAQVSPDSVSLVPGGEASVRVSYGAVAQYSAVDVSIGNISVLGEEQLHVRVGDRDFWSTINHTTPVRRLPASGKVSVGIDQITLNNSQYSFNTQSQDISPDLYTFSFAKADDFKDVTPEDVVPASIEVQADIEVDATIPVRLRSPSTGFIYRQSVKAQAGTTRFEVPLAPDTYTVEVRNFIQGGVVYALDVPATWTVEDVGATLPIRLRRGPNLRVPGFPNFLSFGGLADHTPSNKADFVAARASSVFKYAGTDGAGDAGRYLTDDAATTRTIQLARDVEGALGDGTSVLPVMISYTCNLSLGDTQKQLQNAQGLAHSFGNLILSLRLAQAAQDEDHPVPAGYVINPDFLGACQQEKGSLPASYAMPVVEPLREALDHWKCDHEIPGRITNTLAGYVLAVNWLFRTILPSVTFGWQANLWGVGASTWVYGDDDPAVYARQTAEYIRSLGAYDDDEFRPDFLAVDRYEADDFATRGFANGYCYSPRQWARYFDFCRALGVEMAVPIMAWQIPSSHIPSIADAVADSFADSQHWGTGGSYILGDAAIGSDYENVNPKILALDFPQGGRQRNVGELFEEAQPFDLCVPAYEDFLQWGIFTVLLGGGATTGIISSVGDPAPWVRSRLNTYHQNAIWIP